MLLGFEIQTPRTQMDPGEDNLLCTPGQRCIDVCQNMFHGDAPPLAAGHCSDAKSAAVIAAILHFDKCPRAQT